MMGIYLITLVCSGKLEFINYKIYNSDMFPIPKVRFYTNEAQTAHYLCFLAHNIYLEYYRNADFTVLPYLAPGINRTVHFPDLSWSPSFWKAIAASGHDDLDKPYHHKAETEAVFKLKAVYKAPDINPLEKEWREGEKKFFSAIDKVLQLNELVSRIDEIAICVGEYGTGVSYFCQRQDTGKYRIIMSGRADSTATTYAGVFLQCLYTIASNPAEETGNSNWWHKMATVKFLLSKTRLGQVYKDHKLSDPSPRHLSDSEEYLKKLGYGSNTNPENLSLELTPQEKALWAILNENRQKIVSFDQAAVAVWAGQTDEKFSLYSLAKLVENLRRKIRASGINRTILLTVRRQGYVLK